MDIIIIIDGGKEELVDKEAISKEAKAKQAITKLVPLQNKQHNPIQRFPKTLETHKTESILMMYTSLLFVLLMNVATIDVLSTIRLTIKA